MSKGVLIEVRDELDTLARLGNEPYYGNSDGNIIARRIRDILEKFIESVPDGLEYAANYVRLDCEIRESQNYPKSYTMWLPRDKNYCSDYQVLKLSATAKLLQKAIKDE